jgi:hypothetical protein
MLGVVAAGVAEVSLIYGVAQAKASKYLGLRLPSLPTKKLVSTRLWSHRPQWLAKKFSSRNVQNKQHRSLAAA